jgi:peptide/nickel transport system permease protein
MAQIVENAIAIDSEEAVVARSQRIGARQVGRWIALGYLVILVFVAIFTPFVAPDNPSAQQLALRLTKPIWLGGPHGAGLFGRDELGRDVFSRLLFGARISLLVGFGAATAAALIGITVGAYVGYFRSNFLARLLMQLIDIQTAFPFLLIAIAVVSIVGASVQTIIAVVAVWIWVPFARVTIARVSALREAGYVKASLACGRRPMGALVRHILPNIVASVSVVWAFVVAEAIIAESALSYLGLGVAPPTASWGSMIAEGQEYLQTAWWIAGGACLMIATVVLSVNVVGSWMADLVGNPGQRSVLL